MLTEHAQRKASVIVAPAMHEGLDLKGDLSRFQMICKIPYPDATTSKQLQIRTRENWRYYLWLTALKLVQSYGRSVRSETDYAQTYILDSGAILLNNIAIYRDAKGALNTRFPHKLGKQGQKYYHCCPIHREAKEIIDAAILAHLSA